MSDKIDFKDIQTLAQMLNKIHTAYDISATLTIYEHFTRDEVQDIVILNREDFTAKEIAVIYGTDTAKVKRVLKLITNKKKKRK